jgi:hypothetical protein
MARDQVIKRIEQLVQQLVTAAASGTLPELSCISRAASNVHLADVMVTAVHRSHSSSTAARRTALAPGVAADVDSPSQQQLQEAMDHLQDVRGDMHHAATASNVQQQVLRLGSKVQKKTLLANNGAQAHSIVRGELMMSHLRASCQHLTSTSRQATTRLSWQRALVVLLLLLVVVVTAACKHHPTWEIAASAWGWQGNRWHACHVNPRSTSSCCCCSATVAGRGAYLAHQRPDSYPA